VGNAAERICLNCDWRFMNEPMMQTLLLQRTAFNSELPVPASVRKDRLKRIIAMLSDHHEAFATALSDDFGHRSREQSLASDIAAGIRQSQYAIKNLDRWMRPEKRGLQFPLGLFGAKASVHYQPKGVVGVIAPWNFPVQLTIGPMAGAFAAGNRVMVKSSEITPIVAALFEEIAPQYFDRAEAAFFSGGPDVGQRFAALSFDHLIFTGATSVGRHILRAAADNLVPVTLELGGKSPTILGQSADIASAVGKIATGKMMNAGQICLAPDYMLVPRGHEEAVVASLKSAVAEMYPTLLRNDDYTSVVNDRHHDRLTGLIDDARSKGAEIIEINPAGEDFSGTNGNKMPLYVVRGTTDDMTVMQEEVFGPILPIVGYTGIDEAIDYVNARPRPLGLYYFGSDAAEESRVIERTISGGVTVNDVLFHAGIEDLPFGGIGPSGMGSYHGLDGFKTFSHAKSIYSQGRLDLAKLGGMKPPYGKATAKMIAGALRLR
jgi:coniferyl-aldehyde dehydrogenase